MYTIKISDELELDADVATALKASADKATQVPHVHLNNLLRHVLDLKDPLTGKPVGKSGAMGG